MLLNKKAIGVFALLLITWSSLGYCAPSAIAITFLTAQQDIPHILKLQQKTQLLNLNNFSFAGATSYIINPLSLIKVDRLLSQEESLDVPYDIYLRTLVEKDILKGYVVFPFITTLSNDSEESQIQLTKTANTDTIWNTFRRMIWLERDLNDFNQITKKIQSDLCDTESVLFSRLIAALISDKFVNK